ncbi:MAG: nicotinate-nucleotide--dimethylbenzimidazole phosphoribosyltransferase [Gammaproteobacteria bacterium]
MNAELDWLYAPCVPLNENAQQQAEQRQAMLTKPPGALGRLEHIAIRLAALQNVARPCVDKISIAVFAADHGVVAEGVSAFPQSVTAAMVANFAQGGAAISVLARQLQATLEVINLGTVDELAAMPGVLSVRIGPGTANFTQTAAMTAEQVTHALDAGRQSVARARDAGAQLFIGGEMGIGNTTAASALGCALLGAAPAVLAGPGTGLDREGVARKAAVIARALALHQSECGDALQALRRLGGFEIAALTGSYLACAQVGLPVLIDGFIATVAALVAVRLNPAAADWFLYAHASAESGHAHVLAALHAQPLLDIGMRLGEGSGAAVAVPLLRLACALHNEMATFAEAAVAEKL